MVRCNSINSTIKSICGLRNELAAATTDGGQKAQSYNRTWSWLETTHDFVPIRYDKIVDDGVPLPIS